MENKKNINPKIYFKLSTFTFLSLSFEVLIAFIFQSLIYKQSTQFWSSTEVMIFNTLTYFVWGTLGYIILQKAKTEIDFNILKKTDPLSLLQWFVITLLIVLTFIVSYANWNGIKIIRAYQHNGIVLFLFQHILFLVETFLITMLIAFLQKGFEFKFKNPYIPYVGILFSIVWCTIALLIQAPLVTLLYGGILSFLIGSVYLICNKNFIYSFLLVFLLFII